MSAITSGTLAPGVTYQILPSPQSVLLPAGVAEVAFVGKGSTTKLAPDVTITRGSAQPTHGTSTSDVAAAVTTSSGDILTLNLDGDGAKAITLGANISGAAVAADIQAKVRALIATTPAKQYAYNNFFASYNVTSTEYKLSSGTVGTGSTIVVSATGVAVTLKLGLGNGGSEAAGAGSTQDTASVGTITGPTSIIDSNGVNYFSGFDYIIVAPNIVDWHLGGNIPQSAYTYVLSSQTAKVASDYTMKTTFSLAETETLYGSSSVESNELSVAAKLFFLNGGVKLNLVQVNGSDINAFLNAFDLLAAEQLDVVVALQANTSGFEFLFPQLRGRVFELSQPALGYQRMVFVAPAIGTTISEYMTLAQAMSFNRMVVTAPSSITMTFAGTSTEVPAYFLNAAISGFLGSPDNLVSEPVTNKQLLGIDDVGVKYNRGQISNLIGAGVLIVQNRNGIVAAVQAITTDRTSVENNEVSLIRIADFFGKTLRTVLTKIYVGSRIDTTAIPSIRSTISSVAKSFIDGKVLVQTTEPSVTQNKDNPTEIDVTIAIQPVYPLNFISVSFSMSLLG